jgi:hypothetical protein
MVGEAKGKGDNIHVVRENVYRGSSNETVTTDFLGIAYRLLFRSKKWALPRFPRYPTANNPQLRFGYGPNDNKRQIHDS